MQETSHGRSCDIQLNVCSLFWLEPVTSEEFKEEAAHDHLDFNVPSTAQGHRRTNKHFFKSQTFRTITG